MKKISIIFTMLYFISSPLMASDIQSVAKEKLENHRFMIGDWQVLNRSLRPDGTIVEQPFYVEIDYIADGMALRNIWSELGESDTDDDEPEKGAYFGTVFQTYDPNEDTIVTNYFNATQSKWSSSSREVTFSDGLIEASGEDSDGFGAFKYYMKTERITENHHRWISQRLYEALGFWITVDTYEAYRIED